ncbi:MAG: iron transporter [Actinomycetota bacterium]|nr:iron transporter [Actinomycetota bacterium]
MGSGVMAHATTRSYIVQLDIGSIENMYTQAQVDSQHPTGGEVMVRGQMSAVGGAMADMPGMGGAVTASDRHLEAHICSKASGAVVQDANPTITLINDATKNVSQDVQIAVMQGVGAPVGDLHYGNNVVLAPGATYTVLISLNGETATLHVKMPTAVTGTTIVGSTTTMPGMP